MKTLAKLTLAALVLFPAMLFGQIVKTVEASGMGSSERSALSDAKRNAVSQVVTTLIESQTTTINEDIVEDKIISVAGGFIDNLKVIEPATKNDSGVYTIKIKADVKYDQLSKEIAQYSSSSGTIDMNALIKKKKQKEKADEQNSQVKEEQQDEMGDFLVKLIDDYIKAWKFDVTELTPGDDEQDIVIDIQGSLSNDTYLSKFVLPTQKRFKALNILPKKSRYNLDFYMKKDLGNSSGYHVYPIELFNWQHDKKAFSTFCFSKIKTKKYILRIELKNANNEVIATKDVEFGRNNYTDQYDWHLLRIYVSYSKISIGPDLTFGEQQKVKKEKTIKRTFTLRVYPPNKITDITSFSVNVLQVDAESPCDEKWYK